MNSNLSQIQDFASGQADLSSVSQTAPVLMGMLIAVLVFSLLNCFFGLKLIRIWSAFFGFVIGFSAGAVVASHFGATKMVYLIVGVVVGIVIGVLGFWLFKAGAFLLAWVFGMGVVVLIAGADSMIKIVIAIVAGLVFAILTILFFEPVIIILTGLQGGLLAGSAIVGLASLPGTYTEYIIGGVLVILGIVVQFVMESKHKVKQHVEKANKVRAKYSAENEVDAARSVLDNTDKVKEDKDVEDYYDDDDDDE